MSTTATPTEVVVHPQTGEILAVRDADTFDLAAFVGDLDDLRDAIKDGETIVLDELLRRMDRNASWTLRTGDPTGDCQYEIKAPSPDAGTDRYDDRLLEQELRQLVARDTISVEGAGAAIKRQVTLTLSVPLDGDPEEIVKAVKGAAEIDVAGITVTVESATVSRSPVMAGINKLRKITGTGAALDRARLPVAQPRRRAKVKRVARPSS